MRLGPAALRVAVALVMALGLVLLTGCAESSDLGDSESQNYVSGDGTVSEFAPANRGEPIDFSAPSETGETITAEQFRGQVMVVNFWYAACPPCRTEAPWLEELHQQFSVDGVQFLGVNVRDTAATSLSFTTAFGITYPSVIDDQAEVTAAFAGIASPTAVPTTVVLDREGRPAARIVGLIEPSTLEALIETALAEDTGS
ncbi:MAG: TlpA family protein disulfide reductase [Actinobacteria bacterium]|nr:TlpA family protein disulfide reductase [Actinomycetota bacterium]